MSSSQQVPRRLFLKASAFSLGCHSLGTAFQSLIASEPYRRSTRSYGALAPTIDQSTGLPLLQLPEGFTYWSFSWTGDHMSDGTVVPGAHDGMAVISEDEDGVITLCRNHELSSALPAFGKEGITYDSNAAGGCSTLKFDAKKSEWLSATPSLSGTVKNCAGGPTPWGSWLSCEETVLGPGDYDDGEQMDFRESHGWVFEVPVGESATANPIKDMGRFVHEAVAVDPETGFVYQTEDNGTAGFYRFIPNKPGNLANGGRLEMLKVVGELDLRTTDQVSKTYDCRWVSIEDPHKPHDQGPVGEQEGDKHGCFSQGKAQGATTFARLEGCWFGNDAVYFDATSGGSAGAGQIWKYDPRAETLTLLFSSPSNEVLDSPDNLAVSPRGGIILCEDGDLAPQRLHGLTVDGELFTFAKNNVQLRGERNNWTGDFRGSEWAGATFSSDGKWLFVNSQSPGITFAITGPWGEGLL